MAEHTLEKRIPLTLDAQSREAHSGGLLQVRRFIEDLLVDLSENASICAEGGRYVFALDEKAYGADEEALELLWLHELL